MQMNHALKPYKCLSRDLANAKIIDNRDPANPLNAVLFTCTHASNALPPTYKWTPFDEENFKDTHWAYDPGAYALGKALSEDLGTVYLHSLYSRLFCDVNRAMNACTLFRKSGDGKTIELNKDLTEEETLQRIYDYYVSYFYGTRIVTQELDLAYVFDMHSFTPEYEGSRRSVEIGLLHHWIDDDAEMMRKFFCNRGWDCRINEPYSAKLGQCHTIDTFATSSFEPLVSALVIEVRNDILLDETSFARVRKDMADLVTLHILPRILKPQSDMSLERQGGIV